LAAISDKVTSNARRSSTFAWLDAPVGEVKTLTGHTSEVTSLALLRGGSQLISGSRDQSIRVWDLAQGKQIGIVQSTIGSVRALGVTGDEKFLVVSGDQANVEVWNLSTSKLAHRVKAKSAPNNMELVRDANVIVVSRGSSASGNIGIFALHGAASGQLNCPSSPRCLAVSDSGKLVAAGAADDKVYVWSLRPAKMADPFTGLGNDPVAIDISPDEKLVAACSDEQAMVWRLDSGEMVSRMQITNRADGLVTNRADGLAFSIDGRRLLTTSYNGVTVWNVEDGSRVDTLTPSRSTDTMLGQRRPIVCLPDPRGAVSTGTGGIIRVWRLPD
jgi:WD40 repeat protein